MRYSCRTVVGHGQTCAPNYQCDACATKQKYIPRIEKLEAALYEIAHINNMRDRFSSEIDNVITTVMGEKNANA